LPPGIDTTRERQDEFVADSPDDRRRPDRQRARIDEIPDEKVPKDMLELASHIVESKSGHFEPEKFEDHYEDALKELLRKKQSGQKIEVPRERAPAKVINVMEALRRSVDAERGSGAPTPTRGRNIAAR
jgi:DNA end-binding protein Ku